MREKLSIEQFDIFKEEILVEIAKISDTIDEMEDEEAIERVYREFYRNVYKPKLDKLLSYDLSAVPADKWDDLYLISMGDDVLNFEGTYANIRFDYIDTNAIEKYNFKSCQISGLNRCDLYLNESCFDEQFVNMNRKYFLDSEFGEDFKKKYYGSKLSFSDYFDLPENLKEKLDMEAFFSRLSNDDCNFINSIFKLSLAGARSGDNNGNFGGVLEFVRGLGTRYEEAIEMYKYLFFSRDVHANLEEFERKVKNVSPEECLEILYSEAEAALSDSSAIINIDKIPKCVAERFPKLLFLDLPIDEEMRNRIYNRRLTAQDYLENYAILLKRVGEEHFKFSSKGKFVGRLIDTLAEDELVEVFGKHNDFIRFALRIDYWFLADIADIKEGDFETRVLTAIEKKFNTKRALILGEYLKDLGVNNLEELKNKLLSLSQAVRGLFDEIFNKLGFENIERFDYISGGALTKNGLYNLVVLGRYMTMRKLPNGKVTSYDEFEELMSEYLVDFIYDIRNIDDVKFDYSPFRAGLQDKHPEIFLTEDEEMFLRSLDSRDLITKFYEGTITLEEILAHPQIITILKNKDLSFMLRYEFHSQKNNLANTLGNERFLYFLQKYGLSIEEIMNEYVHIEENATIEEVEDKLLELFYDVLIEGKVHDFSNFPSEFKNRYPQLFLVSENEELNRKFAHRELSSEDFEVHPEYFEYFKYVDLFAGMSEDYSHLINSVKSPFSVRDNRNKLKVCKVYCTLPKHNKKLTMSFIEYCARNIGELTDEKLKNATFVLERLEYSNSAKLARLKNELADMILNNEDPIGALNKIERIYLTNNLPDVAKIFSVFRVLHSEKDGTLSLNLNANSSPVLNNHSKTLDEIIIYSDLLRTAVESNNLSLRGYIHSLEEGARLLREVDLDNYDDLSDEEKQILKDYSKHLIALYNQTTRGKKEAYISSLNVPCDLFELSSRLGSGADINDRIVRMFMHFIGIDDLASLKFQMDECVRFRDEWSRNCEKGEFTLEAGDMIKGLSSIDYFFPTMQNGALATEFLGSAASEMGDATPLDTDLSYITDAKSDMANTIMGTISSSYGPIWVVIKKGNSKIQQSRIDTKSEDGKYQMDKLEAFRTTTDGHYGIRTGFGSTNIDFIITDKYIPHIGLAIAMQGFYIPVVDKTGNLLFTSKMFDEYKRQMEGLSYYGYDTYKLSNSLSTADITEIARMLEESKRETAFKNQCIKDILAEAVREVKYEDGSMNFTIKDHIDGNLEPGVLELIDIGSTGRGTNEIGDGDFDYIIRVDNDIMKSEEKFAALKDSIMRALGQRDTSFRYKGVTIAGLDSKVDIDISFVSKTDELNYSTDAAIKDKLETIRKEDSKKYPCVLANIIYAKRVLKSYNCYYGHKHSKHVYGGLGGIGVESWILANHGSFIEAAESFLKVANRCNSFEEFKKEYKVWSFGENFYFEKIRFGSDFVNKHDEFVDSNMDEQGYEAMKKCLVDTLNKINKEEFDMGDVEQAKIY